MPSATSYNTVGNREDLTDIVEMVEPEVTPLYSRLPKSKAPSALYQEWQCDSRKNPTITGTVDGTDIQSFSNKAEDRVRMGNRIQEFRESYKVTRLQEMVETAGVSSEYGRSKSKATVDLKIDIESAIGSDNDIQVGSGSVADQFRALGKYIDSANTDIPAIARTSSDQIKDTTSVTETVFNGVLQTCYEKSGHGMGFDLYCGTGLKKKISDFPLYRADVSSYTASYTLNQNAADKRLTRGINVYDSDWGIVNVIPDLFLGRTDGAAYGATGQDRGYLLDPGQVSLAFMQRPTSEEFDDQGGGKRGMISAILTLVCKSSKALGKFY